MPGATVDVDPRCPVPNYTYVLEGLRRTGHAVRFRRLDCPRSHGMAMTVDGVRVWLDTGDSATLLDEPSAWADVVAKLNVAPGTTGVVPLGPVFGVRIWPLPGGYATAARLVVGGARPGDAIRQVRFQGITRLPVDAYGPGRSDPGYVFARSRRWGEKHDAVNRARGRFEDAVRRLPVEADVALVDDRIPLATYLAHVRRSAVVFNTPALHGCLGWKLGEFLALGKAIVSLRLGRDLPAPLVHGEHLHFVDDDVDAIRDAVQRVVEDDEYRGRLERGARDWFDAHLRPETVSDRVVTAALAMGGPG